MEKKDVRCKDCMLHYQQYESQFYEKAAGNWCSSKKCIKVKEIKKEEKSK